MILRNLFSAKQVGILYHYTSFQAGVEIVEKDFMKATDADSYGTTHKSHSGWNPSSQYTKFVSFTRDRNFHRVGRLVGGLSCRFVVDGDKLSERYRFSPYDFFHTTSTSVWDIPEFRDRKKLSKELVECVWKDREISDEDEEIILLKSNQEGIPHFLNYVIRLDYSRKDDDVADLFLEKIRKAAPKLKLGVLL